MSTFKTEQKETDIIKFKDIWVTFKISFNFRTWDASRASRAVLTT